LTREFFAPALARDHEEAALIDPEQAPATPIPHAGAARYYRGASPAMIGAESTPLTLRWTNLLRSSYGGQAAGDRAGRASGPAPDLRLIGRRRRSAAATPLRLRRAKRGA
jgi:hypothetical protein